MEWKNNAGDVLGELQETEKLGADLPQEGISTFSENCGAIFSFACC